MHFLDYNIGADSLLNKPNESGFSFQTSNSSSNTTSTTLNTTSEQINSKQSDHYIADTTYQNDELAHRNSMYSNRATILCEAKFPSAMDLHQTLVDPKMDYYNFSAIANEASKIQTVERTQSMRLPPPPIDGIAELRATQHVRTQSLIAEPRPTSAGTRKIPENLNLVENSIESNAEPSPALSTCSGPYIPISECFSGSPSFFETDNPITPLNSLDPKFYDTPRSHINIGLNLTNDQPYSPKRNNYLPVSCFIWCCSQIAFD